MRVLVTVAAVTFLLLGSPHAAAQGVQPGAVTATIMLTPNPAVPDSTVDATLRFTTDGAGSFRIGVDLFGTSGAGTITPQSQVPALTNCSQLIPRSFGCDWNPSGPDTVEIDVVINVGPNAIVGGSFRVNAIENALGIAADDLGIVAAPTTTTTTTTTTTATTTTSTPVPTTTPSATTTTTTVANSLGGVGVAVAG